MNLERKFPFLLLSTMLDAHLLYARLAFEKGFRRTKGILLFIDSDILLSLGAPLNC